MLSALGAICAAAAIGAPVAPGSPPRHAAVAVMGGAEQVEADQVIEAVRTVLARQAGIDLAASSVEERIFRSTVPKPIEPPLSVARRAVNRSERAFNTFKLADATHQLDEAKEALEPWRGRPEAVELLRRTLVLAVSLAHAERNATATEKALAEYAQTFPGEDRPATAPWPPAVAGRLLKLQPDRNAALSIEAKPPATVYLDGHSAGTTPLKIESITAGEHRLVLEAQRHFRRDVKVVARAGEVTPVSVELDPDLALRLARSSLAKALPDDLAAVLHSTAAENGIDLLILAELREGSGLVLQRIDTGPISSPSNVARVVLAARSDLEIERAIKQLIVGIETEPLALAPTASATGVPLWAWLGIGAGVAAVALGFGFRVDAVSMKNGFEARQVALTQVQAYELRDEADAQALRGTLLLTGGAAALLGLGAYVGFSLAHQEPAP